MGSAGLKMGTISSMTHIKMIFSFSQGNGKHFIGNTLCSSDISVTQLIHILNFFVINNVFYKPPEESNLDKGLENGFPSSYPAIRKLPPHGGKSDLVHHLTWKLFPQRQDTKQCSPS